MNDTLQPQEADLRDLSAVLATLLAETFTHGGFNAHSDSPLVVLALPAAIHTSNSSAR